MAVPAPPDSNDTTINGDQYFFPGSTDISMVEYLCLRASNKKTGAGDMRKFAVSLMQSIDSIAPCLNFHPLPRYINLHKFITNFANQVVVDDDAQFNYALNGNPSSVVSQAIKSIRAVIERKTAERDANSRFHKLHDPAWCAYIVDGTPAEQEIKKNMLCLAIIVYIKEHISKKRGPFANKKIEALDAFKISEWTPSQIPCTKTNPLSGHPNVDVCALRRKGVNAAGASVPIDEANQSYNDAPEDNPNVPDYAAASFHLYDAISPGRPPVTVQRGDCAADDYEGFTDRIREHLNLQEYNIRGVTWTCDYGATTFDLALRPDSPDDLALLFRAPTNTTPKLIVTHDGRVGINRDITPRVSTDGQTIGEGDDAMTRGEVKFYKRGPQWQDRLFTFLDTMPTKHASAQQTDANWRLSAHVENLLSGGLGDEAPEQLTNARIFTFREVQKCAQHISSIGNDVNTALNHLLDCLPGASRQLATQLPPAVPPGIGAAAPPERHLGHQIIGLSWVIRQEETIGGGLYADQMGMGKTHVIIAMIFILRIFWERVQIPRRPTLVVVPGTLRKRWLKDLRSYFRAQGGWKIYVAGGKQQQPAEPGHVTREFLFDQEDPAFHADEPDKVIVLATYESFSHSKGKFDNTPLEGLFNRVILDEAHQIRGDVTKCARLINRFQAPFRWEFSGTPCYNSPTDLAALMRFLERSHWDNPDDLNKYVDGEANKGLEGHYMNFMYPNNPACPIDTTDVPTPYGDEWNEEPDDPNDPDVRRDAHGRLTQVGPSCRNWPAKAKVVRKRNDSVSAEARGWDPLKKAEFKENWDLDNPNVRFQMTAPEPAYPNPYEGYHRLNRNKKQCLTVDNFYYFIHPHTGKGDTKPSRTTLEERMFPIFDQIMLARNSESKIINEDGEEVPCGADIPRLDIVRDIVLFEPHEQASYDDKIQALAAFRDEQKRLREEEKRKAKQDGADDDFIRELVKNSRHKPGSRFHQELLVSTYQAASGLVHIPAGVFQGYYKGPLALLDALKQSGGVAAKYATAPHDTPEKVLQHLLDGSPMFRWALNTIDVIVRRAETGVKDKVMVMCLSPKTAHIFYTIVSFMGIESECLTSRQSQDERSDIIDNFNEEANVKVLVATYGLNLAGFNCHHRCARVILLEPAVNGSQEAQAYMRVHRIGQTEKQAVMRFHQANSWMDKWDKKLTRKQDRNCAMMLQYLHSRELQQSGDIGIKSASASMVSGYMGSLLDDSDEETDYGDDLPGLLSEEEIAELEEARNATA